LKEVLGKGLDPNDVDAFETDRGRRKLEVML